MKKIIKQEQQTLLTMIKEQQIKSNVAMILILKVEKILKGRLDFFAFSENSNYERESLLEL